MGRARRDQLVERSRADEIELRQRVHQAPPLWLAASIARALLQRGKDAIGRHRQIVEAQPGGVGDGIGERRQERGERAFAGFLGAERPVRIVALDDADFDRRRILRSSARDNRACWR